MVSTKKILLSYFTTRKICIEFDNLKQQCIVSKYIEYDVTLKYRDGGGISIYIDGATVGRQAGKDCVLFDKFTRITFEEFMFLKDDKRSYQELM
jgi:hypothetical protein